MKEIDCCVNPSLLQFQFIISSQATHHRMQKSLSFPLKAFSLYFFYFIFCFFSLLRDFDTTVQLASQSQVNCPFNFFVDPPIFSFLFSVFCAFNNLKLSDLMRPVSTRFYSSSSKRSTTTYSPSVSQTKFEISFFNFFYHQHFFSVGLSLHSSAEQGHKFILIVKKQKKLKNFPLSSQPFGSPHKNFSLK